jgi:hypothetical protein
MTWTRSIEGLLIHKEARFGNYLLYEVEAFQAEEFSSAEEARDLIRECATITLTNMEASLEKTFEVTLHPEWLPELREGLRNAYARTVASLESDTVERMPAPPYRWRLPPDVVEAAWAELTDRWPVITSRRTDSSTATSIYVDDPVNEFKTRDIKRIRVLQHPGFGWLSGFDTDVTLLTEPYEWGPYELFDLCDRHLTCDTFDWVVLPDPYGDGDLTAYGWAAHDQ